MHSGEHVPPHVTVLELGHKSQNSLSANKSKSVGVNSLSACELLLSVTI